MTDVPPKSHFQKTLEALQDSGVRFVVIGGVAMGAHGLPHVTFDLDICYDRSKENVAKLVRAIRPWHPRLRGAPAGLPFVLDEPTVQAGLNFTLRTDVGDLDLLGEVAGVGFYPQALASAVRIDVLGIVCDVLSIDGLIAAKRAAGRERDKAHLRELQTLKESGIDNKT